MNFGVMANADHDEAIRIILTALDAGINLIDTADVYSHGESEQVVGEAIKARRDEVVLEPKFSNPMGDSPNQRGGSRRLDHHRRRRLAAALGHRNYIDLYQYHYPDDSTDIEETLSVLTDLVRSGEAGAIRHPSSSQAAGIVEAHWVSERMGSNASAASSRTTPSSIEASNATSFRPPSATAWARSSGAR